MSEMTSSAQGGADARALLTPSGAVSRVSGGGTGMLAPGEDARPMLTPTGAVSPRFEDVTNSPRILHPDGSPEAGLSSPEAGPSGSEAGPDAPGWKAVGLEKKEARAQARPRPQIISMIA